MREDPAVRRGVNLVRNGDLRRLRERLGLTRTAMAVLLYVSPVTYAQWEERPEMRMWKSTSLKIGRFYETACAQLDLLEQEGVDLQNMIPFHVAATLLGVPQELLLERYRSGRLVAADMGVLGLWIYPANIGRVAS